MISDIENSLLVKYLKNELSEEESQKVIGWLEQNKENQEFLFGLKDLYMLGRWEELSRRADTAHGWEKLSGTIRKQHQSKNVFSSYLKYAAILIVFFSITCSRKQPNEVRLPDEPTGCVHESEASDHQLQHKQ